MNKMVITITGPSGSGKSHLERLLVERGFGKIISVTTRPPREGEVDGVDYFFTTRENFEALEEKGAMVESVEFSGNRYGATVAEFERCFAENKPVVVVVEPHGMTQIRRAAQKHGWRFLSVFLKHDIKTLIERVLNRDIGSVSIDAIANRLLNMTYEEKNWLFAHPWDVVIEDFGAETQADAVEFILRHVRAASGVDLLGKTA